MVTGLILIAIGLTLGGLTVYFLVASPRVIHPDDAGFAICVCFLLAVGSLGGGLYLIHEAEAVTTK